MAYVFDPSKYDEVSYLEIKERADRARDKKLEDLRKLGKGWEEGQPISEELNCEMAVLEKAPSPDEIAMRAAMVRQNWSEKDYVRRAGAYAPEEAKVLTVGDLVTEAVARRKGRLNCG